MIMSEPVKTPEAKPAKKSVPVFFKDFGKAVNDILKPSKFDFGKQVEVKTKTTTGVSFITSGTFVDEDVAGKLVIKSNVCKSTDFEGELHTSGKFTGKIISEKLAPGLKITASNEAVPSKGTSLHVLESLYARNNMATSLAVTSNLGKDYKVDGSVVFGFKGVAVGGQATYKDNVLVDYNGGIEYTADEGQIVTLKTSNKADKSILSYSHVLSPITTLVASFSYDIGKSSPGKSFSLGGSYKIDDVSSLTSTWTTTGQQAFLSALYEVKIRPTAQLSLSSIVDLQGTLYPGSVSRSGPGARFGIKLTLG